MTTRVAASNQRMTMSGHNEGLQCTSHRPSSQHCDGCGGIFLKKSFCNGQHLLALYTVPKQHCRTEHPGRWS